MTDDQADFVRFIDCEIDHRGLYDVACLLHVSVQTLERWLVGMSYPTPSRVAEIYEALR